jgi:uncharacterized protein
MALPFIFLDLLTTDVAEAREFYTEMFGWNVAEVPFGDKDLPMLVDQDGPWGGFTQIADGDGRIPQWVPYVSVDDLEKTTGQATGLGATIVRPRMDLPVASLTVFADPAGALFVLWEPHAQG